MEATYVSTKETVEQEDITEVKRKEFNDYKTTIRNQWTYGSHLAGVESGKANYEQKMWGEILNCSLTDKDKKEHVQQIQIQATAHHIIIRKDFTNGTSSVVDMMFGQRGLVITFQDNKQLKVPAAESGPYLTRIATRITTWLTKKTEQGKSDQDALKAEFDRLTLNDSEQADQLLTQLT